MSDLLKDPKHWQERADEARRVASQLTDLDARKTMLGIAASYELLSQRAQLRVGKDSK
jgi:hypothetical protein